jgi:diguanylate cyclase (GGDEF)-like protein
VSFNVDGERQNGGEGRPGKGRRRWRAVAFVALVIALGAAAAAACVAGGYGLARQSDRAQADEQRAALRAAVGEFRALFGNSHEVDPRFIRMIEQSAGLKDLRFDAEPSAGGAIQPVVNGEGRIVGFLNWTPATPMADLVERFAPAMAGSAFALVVLSGIGFWQFRRSRLALAESEERARAAAQRDSLTGLANSSTMKSLVEAAMAHRESQDVVSYASMALRGLEGIIETYGQHAADDVVAIVAARLRDVVPADVNCAHVGGGTFAFMWRKGREPEALLHDTIEVAVRPHWIDTMVRVGAYGGYAQAPRDATTCSELLRRAELALRAAEKKGPGAIVPFAQAIDAAAGVQQFIRRELPRAVAAGALDLHYQPIVASENGRIAGVEALLRWTHKDRGPISPAQFIPVAEQIGLMDDLGAFVLRHALKDAKNWPDVYISVNLSPLQVRDRRIVDVVREALWDSGIAPSKLMLEITEGVLIDNPEEMLKRIEDLRAIGVRIALDDFGSGYSSLGYLQRFPFDKLKIDRSFVSALGRSPNAAVIIQAIVALGRALGVTVVVEGVETEEQRVLLRLAGCDEMQGFLFAKPAPPKAIDLMIAPPAGVRPTAA